MERENHYATVSEAISQLQKKGFTIDFNLKENSIVYHDEKFHTNFEIVDVYRYEGDTDPADEAVVYAIQSKTGLKGILVTGYGPSIDSDTVEILRKLQIKKD
jgi:hypothetical protein